ncbi:hypothetical protein CP532_3102 [Ophiocordyceps camponoti-leonardi (nom. inval.)]|nr:hypothetical protein CP532_3102 [Ophiocordyceps camponoti-leonardi (nom. inval.)]
MHLLSIISAELLLVTLTTATGFLPPALPLPINGSHPHHSNSTLLYFDQFIDHSDHSLGTFRQRFWYNIDHWGGPGSPILFKSPDEAPVEESGTTSSPRNLNGLLAKTNKAALIILEHRYFGESLPFGKNFSTPNMRYQTLDNAMQDIIHFAHSVDLPFDRSGSSKPGKSPWIISGCSYSGALAAWINVLSPGTFWASHCGSAVVEAISDLSGYFGQVEKAMPRNCSADIKRVVSYFDRVLDSGSEEERRELKKMYNVTADSSDGDLASTVTNAVSTWQDVQFTKASDSYFFGMCDYVENQWPGSNSPVPDADGVGMERAVKGLGKWVTEIMPTIPHLDDDAQNSWLWFLCNEPKLRQRRFEWWQIAGPDDGGIVPKAVSRDYYIQQCKKQFPTRDNVTIGIDKGRTVEQVNAKTGGWDKVKTTRLLWVNGGLDPWLPATVSSEKRPGGPLRSTEEAPVWVIPHAAHCNEMNVRNGEANDGARLVIDGVVRQMKEWVDEFYKQDGKGV